MSERFRIRRKDGLAYVGWTGGAPVFGPVERAHECATRASAEALVSMPVYFEGCVVEPVETSDAKAG